MNYEVQTYKNGKWVISSVQDDKDEGIYEAQRLIQNKRTSAVRVVQEVFDESNDTYRMKVVFRRSRKGSEESSPEGAKSEGERKHKKRVKPEDIPLMERITTAVNKGVTAFLSSMVFLILKFTVIIGLGIWLLVTMNDLAEKL
ncbi:MAG: hypothetical protein ISR48_11690 [Alphaproteobacteria bacterium]|nr:hypothetical protein [Alphaproteobacteria bacterium]